MAETNDTTRLARILKYHQLATELIIQAINTGHTDHALSYLRKCRQDVARQLSEITEDERRERVQQKRSITFRCLPFSLLGAPKRERLQFRIRDQNQRRTRI